MGGGNRKTSHGRQREVFHKHRVNGLYGQFKTALKLAAKGRESGHSASAPHSNLPGCNVGVSAFPPPPPSIVSSGARISTQKVDLSAKAILQGIRTADSRPALSAGMEYASLLPSVASSSSSPAAAAADDSYDAKAEAEETIVVTLPPVAKNVGVGGGGGGDDMISIGLAISRYLSAVSLPYSQELNISFTFSLRCTDTLFDRGDGGRLPGLGLKGCFRSFFCWNARGELEGSVREDSERPSTVSENDVDADTLVWRKRVSQRTTFKSVQKPLVGEDTKWHKLKQTLRLRCTNDLLTGWTMSIVTSFFYDRSLLSMTELQVPLVNLSQTSSGEAQGISADDLERREAAHAAPPPTYGALMKDAELDAQLTIGLFICVLAMGQRKTQFCQQLKLHELTISRESHHHEAAI